MTRRNLPPDSQPNDLVGTDASGKVRIDRVIPLPWLIGIVGAGVISSAQQYFGQQRLIDEVKELRGEMRVMTQAAALSSNRDTEHSMLIQGLQRDSQEKDRRIANLEARKP